MDTYSYAHKSMESSPLIKETSLAIDEDKQQQQQQIQPIKTRCCGVAAHWIRPQSQTRDHSRSNLLLEAIAPLPPVATIL